MRRTLVIAAVAALGLFGAYDTAEACCGAYYEPVIKNLSCDPGELWPPNHKYRDIMVTADVTPNTGEPANVTADWKVVSVTSDQPDNTTGVGDGNTTNDCYVEVAYTNDPDTGKGYGIVRARAERCGETAQFLGRGRTYTIVIQGWSRGSYVDRTATESCQVYVPHDRSGN